MDGFTFPGHAYTFLKSTITKTCPCNKQRVFSAVKIKNLFQNKIEYFNIFAQNIDCGNTLEPRQRDGSNEYPQYTCWLKIRGKYIPLYTLITYIKVGLRRYTFFYFSPMSVHHENMSV